MKELSVAELDILNKDLDIIIDESLVLLDKLLEVIQPFEHSEINLYIASMRMAQDSKSRLSKKLSKEHKLHKGDVLKFFEYLNNKIHRRIYIKDI